MGGRLANPADPKEKAFYDTVHELAKIANLPQPPAVYIIPTEEMNAFAAGTRPGSQVTAATTVRFPLSSLQRCLCASVRLSHACFIARPCFASARTKRYAL